MSQPRIRRPSARARANSITSDSDFAPRHRSQSSAPLRRQGTRGVRATTVDNDISAAQPEPTSVKASRIPAHFSLAPTVPSPFTGTLDASLDAVLEWGHMYIGYGKGVQGVVDTLLRDVDVKTNWSFLLKGMSSSITEPKTSRKITEDLLFLTTRTLLPEQISENRGLMTRLYDRRRGLAFRIVLRYDMLREWKMDASLHPVSIASVVPTTSITPAIQSTNPSSQASIPRKPLMPNIWSTLIAAPPGGYATFGYRERMKHHVTDLDSYLMIADEEVARWSDDVLLAMTAQIILQWQWLRSNNAIFDEMEVNDYEAFDGKAEECEWIVDDPKRVGWGRRESKITAREIDELGVWGREGWCDGLTIYLH